MCYSYIEQNLKGCHCVQLAVTSVIVVVLHKSENTSSESSAVKRPGATIRSTAEVEVVLKTQQLFCPSDRRTIEAEIKILLVDLIVLLLQVCILTSLRDILLSTAASFYSFIFLDVATTPCIYLRDHLGLGLLYGCFMEIPVL